MPVKSVERSRGYAGAAPRCPKGRWCGFPEVRGGKTRLRKLLAVLPAVGVAALLWGESGAAAVMESTHLFSISAHLKAPTSVAVDSSGNLYVSESSQNRLQVFDPGGGYRATLEGLDRPLSVAVDGRGLIYIGNAGRRNVEVYGPDLRLLRTLGAARGEVDHPSGITVDGRNRIFVVDGAGKTIRVYGPEGSLERTIDGPGEGPGQLGIPVAAAVDEESGELFVADAGNVAGMVEKYNSRILVFDADGGGFKREFGGYGVGEGLLVKPLGIEADGRGRVFVSDAFQNVVQVFDRGGTFLTTFYEENHPLRTPLGLAYDGTRSRLFVASLTRERVEAYAVSTPLTFHTLHVDLAGTGKGFVNIEPGGALCIDDCSSEIQAGETVFLTVEVPHGSVFAGWAGECSGRGSCEVVMEGDRNVTALFSAVTAAAKAPRDVNGDGVSEILGWDAASGSLFAWMTSEGFPSPRQLLGVTGRRLDIEGAGYFTGGGRASILLRDGKTGEIFLWPMDGSAPGILAGSVQRLKGKWTLAGIADFDGNGQTDILWRDVHSGHLNLWRMGGPDSVVESRINAGSMKRWTVAAVGDFEGDGSSDILWRHEESGALALWLIEGGTVKGQTLIASSSDPLWRIAAAADFNRDGNSDVLWHCPESGSFHLWLMEGPKVMMASPAGVIPSPEWTVIGAGDFNGDGYADVHGVSESTGELRVWLMDGFRVVESHSVGVVSAGVTVW